MKFIDTPHEFEQWCSTHGYTKDDLARILGVTRQTIYNWTHKPDYRSHRSSSEEVKKDIETKEKAHAKIPRMLSYALLAIELMAPQNVFGGRRLRKKTKRL
jgi:transposase